MNFRPADTWLAPLSSYVDPYETAKAQLDAYEAQQAQEAAEAEAAAEDLGQMMDRVRVFLATCPEDMLRRFAAGHPAPGDCWRADVGSGLSEDKADRRLADGTYRWQAALAARAARAGEPGPIQLMARDAVNARGLAFEVQPVPASRQPISTLAIWGWACAAGLLMGIVMTAAGLPDGTVSGSQPTMGLVVPGVLLILASIIVPIVAFIITLTRENRRWLDQFPPEKRTQIVRAQKYVMRVGALATADLGLRELSKRTNAHTAQMKAIMEQHQQPAKAERDRQELLDAIRQPGQPQVDPSQQLLANSRRNREYHATGHWNNDLGQY